MAENKLADISSDFAVKILNLTDSIKGHHSLANQLERSGTSIGANIREAKYAHSKADFFPNYKSHSRSVMKRNTGLRSHKKQISFPKKSPKVFFMIAAPSAEC